MRCLWKYWCFLRILYVHVLSFTIHYEVVIDPGLKIQFIHSHLFNHNLTLKILKKVMHYKIRLYRPSWIIKKEKFLLLKMCAKFHAFKVNVYKSCQVLFAFCHFLAYQENIDLFFTNFKFKHFGCRCRQTKLNICSLSHGISVI